MAILLLVIYTVGVFIWIGYWMRQSNKYEKEHPFGSGTYNVFDDPGGYAILAIMWPIALISIWIVNILGIVLNKIYRKN